MIVKIKNTRLAFPALFEAKTVNGEGSPRFSAAFILPPDHPQVAEINAAIETVAKGKWGDKAPAILKQLRAQDKVCLHDGATKSQYDGFTGNLYLAASNKVRPVVLDRNATPLIAADGRPYAGCYVIGSVEIWAQDDGYGKRINAALRGVQFFADGDAFGSGAPPASPDEFDDLTVGADAETLA
jgi:hypothetical protein